MIKAFCFLSALGLVKSNVVVVRQEESRDGLIETLSEESGMVTTNSSLSFPFSWPYVQMSTDPLSGLTFLAAFPDGFSYPVLYRLDRELNVEYSWDKNEFTFWDMQYSPEQSTIYGIMVTEDFNGGMYGRTLSNYTADEEKGTITGVELYTLPYMWYVNASSFDKSVDVYYALVNNFPGKENSTLDQKLTVADFSVEATPTSPPDVTLLDIESGDIMLQFISFSRSQQMLYFSGPSKVEGSGDATVGVICHEHGKIHTVLAELHDVVAVGPIAADDREEKLAFFMKFSSDPNQWKLFTVGYAEGSEIVEVAQYNGDSYASFAATSYI